MFALFPVFEQSDTCNMYRKWKTVSNLENDSKNENRFGFDSFGDNKTHFQLNTMKGRMEPKIWLQYLQILLKRVQIIFPVGVV